jgi:DNA polymerase delta subunit 1
MYDGDPLKANPCVGRNVPGSHAGPVPVLRLYGVTQESNSVCVHIHGFTPYFYVPPPPGFKAEHVGVFRMALDAAVKAAARGRCGPNNAILAVNLVKEKQSLFGFQADKTSSYLQVYASMPTMVSTARGVLERGFGFGSYREQEYQVYEANLNFVVRFMVDQSIVGCNWLQLPAGTYAVRRGGAGDGGGGKSAVGSGGGAGAGGWPLPRKTHCQLEVDVVYDAIISHAPDGEWQRVAPVRILSFDIECMGRKGVFPEPSKVRGCCWHKWERVCCLFSYPIPSSAPLLSFPSCNLRIL